MQQAILVDIALIVPGLLAGLTGLAGNAFGLSVPSGVQALGDDVVFATLMLTLAYATASSLLGQTPDKIPFISKSVEDQMNTSGTAILALLVLLFVTSLSSIRRQLFEVFFSI